MATIGYFFYSSQTKLNIAHALWLILDLHRCPSIKRFNISFMNLDVQHHRVTTTYPYAVQLS